MAAALRTAARRHGRRGARGAGRGGLATARRRQGERVPRRQKADGRGDRRGRRRWRRFRAKPMDNTDMDVYWRKEVVSSFVAYALREIRGDDMRPPRLRIARQEL